MAALFWAALGAFLAASLGGLVFVGLRAWRAWQAFSSLAAASASGLERIAIGGERATATVDRVTVRVEELLAAIARLQRAQSRLRILLAAFGEVTSLLRVARSLVG